MYELLRKYLLMCLFMICAIVAGGGKVEEQKTQVSEDYPSFRAATAGSEWR